MSKEQNDFKNSQPFNEWLAPSCDAAKAPAELICDIVRNSVTLQRHHEEKLLSNATVVALNLYSAYLIDPARYVAVPMSSGFYARKSRYRNNLLSYTYMTRIIHVLSAEIEPRSNQPWIEHHPGFFDRLLGKGKLTRIRASYGLCQLFETLQTKSKASEQLNHFSYKIDPSAESIILRDQYGKDIDYEDTDATTEMRSNLERINKSLDKTLINLHLPDYEMEKLSKRMRNEEDRNPIDYSRRRLVRIFNNNSFSDGGRFYHGWWQELPKKYRKYIEIDNDKTVEVDFSALHASMLYQLNRIEAPEGDPYIVDGYEKHRNDLKHALNIMINAKTREDSVSAISRKVKASKKIGADRIYDLLSQKHYAISRYFGSGEGVKLQFQDSVIADYLMQALLDEGIKVLPVHDSFIVPAIFEKDLEHMMKTIPEEIFNLSLSSKSKNTELEEINQERRDQEQEELSTAGALFMTLEESGSRSEYKHYYQIREEWDAHMTPNGSL